MSGVFPRIGIITNRGVKEVDSTLRLLLDFLVQQKREVVLTNCCARWLEDPRFASVDKEVLCDHCDLAISIGGDGTMLMASHLLCASGIPLLGINLGRIGFLADIPSHTIAAELGEILRGNFVEDIRFMLEGRVKRRDQVIYSTHAFNDLVIQKWNIARLVKLDTHVDGHFMGTHRSDGMIISTPTGSTAYALSGGGPVLQPTLDALVLVPICPDTLSNRPTVVHGDSRVEVVVGTRDAGQARLTADGEIAAELAPGDRVCIRKGRTIRLLHPAHYEPFRILREKLRWSC